MQNIPQSFSLNLLAIVLFAAGCTQQPQQRNMSSLQGTSTNYTKAVAVMHPTEGNQVSGTVTFRKVAAGVRVTADISGLEEGKHGFHVHHYGDCTAPGGKSAGGHYNPTDNDHGAPTQDNRHMGDMGNITADGEGNATLEYTDPVIELNGSNSIVGHAVVVHGGEDDLTSQPSGNAGPRIGCGVIGIAQPDTTQQ